MGLSLQRLRADRLPIHDSHERDQTVRDAYISLATECVGEGLRYPAIAVAMSYLAR